MHIFPADFLMFRGTLLLHEVCDMVVSSESDPCSERLWSCCPRSVCHCFVESPHLIASSLRCLLSSTFFQIPSKPQPTSSLGMCQRVRGVTEILGGCHGPSLSSMRVSRAGHGRVGDKGIGDAAKKNWTWIQEFQ